MNRTQEKGMASEAPLWLRASRQHGKAQEGMALILTLILLAVLSAMAISLMFLSQSETWATMNYRLMNQARNGAEAGLNVAANFIVNTPDPVTNLTDPNKYTPPATTGPDLISAYTITGSPVKVVAGGNPVVLSANSDVLPYYNPAYPTAQTNFNTTAQGNLTAGNTTINYKTYAALLSMRSVNEYGTTTPRTIQSWRITSNGNIGSGIGAAQVEVEAILERPVMPTFNYAAFGTSPNCGSLNWGGTTTDTGSYDSSCILTSCPTTQPYGGNVGTNGNLTEAGGATIYGSLSTPATGVGNTCTNVSNVPPCTPSPCNIVPSPGINELPQTITYPTPVVPPPGTYNFSSPGMNSNWNCPSGANAIAGCTDSPNPEKYIPPGSYGDFDLTGANLHLRAPACATAPCTSGIYNINSISETGSSTLIIDCTVPCGAVILNVTGNGFSGNQTPIKLTGGGISNPSLNPMLFQIVYAGTATVAVKGGTQTAASIYAPNAAVELSGGSNFYGSIIGSTVKTFGNTHLYYDRNMQNTAFTVGNYMLSQFTWKKY